MEDLSGLAALVAVVEAGGFTPASRRLQLSKSGLSKQISRLESRLGVRLLHRSTRKLSLTEAGAAYYRHAVRALDEARAAEDAVAGLRAQPRGLLRVATPMTFGLLHIAPALPEFMRRHPELRLELVMEDRITDLVEQGIDVAIRATALADSGLVARRLGGSAIVLCASPDYLARRGAPTSPSELLEHDCLVFTPTGREWHLEGPDGKVSVQVPPRLLINSGLALREAALAGSGIVRLPTFTVADELAAGTLVTVLPEYRLQDVPIYAVFPAGRHVPAKSRLFADFLAERIASAAWASEAPAQSTSR